MRASTALQTSTRSTELLAKSTRAIVSKGLAGLIQTNASSCGARPESNRRTSVLSRTRKGHATGTAAMTGSADLTTNAMIQMSGKRTYFDH